MSETSFGKDFYQYKSRVEDEAFEMKGKVDSGEAKDYSEAELMVAREHLKELVSKVRTGEGSMGRESFIENSWLDKKVKDQLKKEWERGGQDREKVNDMIINHSYLGSDSMFRFLEPLYTLPYAEGADQLVELLKPTEDKERELLNREKLTTMFFEIKVTPEDIESFLDSKLVKLVSPELILKKMSDQGASVEVRQRILTQFEGKINLNRQELYGEKSIYKGFSDQKNLEKEGVDKVLSTQIGELVGNTTKVDQRFETYESKNADPENIAKAISFLKKAVESGVKIPDVQQKLKDLGRSFNYVDGYYSQSYIGRIRNVLTKTEALVAKNSGDRPEGLKGEGVEVMPSESDGAMVYLDGEFAFAASNASFSDSSSNGEVVAYLVTEQIDYNTISGPQIRKRVMGWRKGMKEPKELFEDHAYFGERHFDVAVPKVDDEGKVLFTHNDGKRTVSQTVEVS